MMFIDKHACIELGLPEPKKYHTQDHYIATCLLKGCKINTRICRHIGIGNLHSLKKAIKNRVEFMEYKDSVFCPKLKLIPPHKVLIIYMTHEQIKQHLSNKKPA